jgi:hypothetical protein
VGLECRRGGGFHSLLQVGSKNVNSISKICWSLSVNSVLITKLGFSSLQAQLNYPDLVIKWAYRLLVPLSLLAPLASLSLSSSWSPLSARVCFVFVVLVFGGFVLSAILITSAKAFSFQAL